MTFELSGSVDTPRRTRASIAETDDDDVDRLGKSLQCAALPGKVRGEVIERRDAGKRRTFGNGMRRE